MVRINKTVFTGIKKVFLFFSTLWVILYMINENVGDISFTLYVLIGAALAFFYCKSSEHSYRSSTWVSFLLTVFTMFGHDKLSILNKTLEMKTVFGFIVSFIAIWAFFRKALNHFFSLMNEKEGMVRRRKKHLRFKPGVVFGTAFATMWVIYFLFFLNQYPGSLSCDTPSQLSQALGYSAYENANPLIHTLFLTLCIRIGLAVFGNVNAAVAVYSVVQFTMAAAVFSYVVSSIYKKKYHALIVVFTFLYFAILPHNIIYATGMWKDTFFSLLFLLTLTFLWNILEKKQNRMWEYVVLFVLTVVCALARNSGWSSLAVGTAVLFITLYKSNKSMLPAIVSALGVGSAVIILVLVYPLCGITNNGGVTSGVSVPLQQISRVICEEGNISQEDYELLGQFIETEEIPEKYDENISDPIKKLVKQKVMNEQLGQFLKLWLRIGMDNPREYLEAYIALSDCYWSLNSSGWTWDVSIFDNDLGVYRERILLPEMDLEANMYSILSSIPKIKMIYRSSTVLWLALVGFGLSLVRKNRIAIPIFVTALMIYAGLMFTSPVALFRYTYAVSISVPLMMCLPFAVLRKKDSSFPTEQ